MSGLDKSDDSLPIRWRFVGDSLAIRWRFVGDSLAMRLNGQ
jgi:hypothetical protein